MRLVGPLNISWWPNLITTVVQGTLKMLPIMLVIALLHMTVVCRPVIGHTPNVIEPKVEWLKKMDMTSSHLQGLHYWWYCGYISVVKQTKLRGMNYRAIFATFRLTKILFCSILTFITCTDSTRESCVTNSFWRLKLDILWLLVGPYAGYMYVLSVTSFFVVCQTSNLPRETPVFTEISWKFVRERP